MTNPTLATPLTVGLWELPPCSELAPYAPDDRLVWTVRCAVVKELASAGDKRLERLTSQMLKWDTIARAQMLAGFTSGASSAVASGVSSAASDLARLMFEGVRVLAGGADVALDPEVWLSVTRVTNAAPESEESRKAIEHIRKYVGAEHAEFMEAVAMAAMVMSAIRALNRWVNSDPSAGLTILKAVAGELGKLAGEVASNLAEAETPYGVGAVLGDLCGSMLVQCARFYYGV